MALRFPHLTKSTTSTTGTGTYTLTETPAVGYRTLTRAVVDGDLASLDEVCYIATDRTVTDGPRLLEVGKGVWNNTTKTLTRGTVYQPNGVAVSWGAGTRDVLIIDNPVLYLLLAGGTMTGLLHILITGAAITPPAGSGLVVQNSSVAGTSAAAVVTSGTSGNAILYLGDTADPTVGAVTYDNTQNILFFRTSGANRVRITSAGVLQTSAGVPYDVLPSGSVTNVVFVQAAAPTGWTQVVAQNDRVLRVVSTAGAGVGGSWTISGISVNGHAITAAQMPSHTHSVAYAVAQATSGGPAFVELIGTGGSSASTGSAGGDATHTHGLTIGSAWRPAYQDAIVCTKT